MKVIPETCRVQ